MNGAPGLSWAVDILAIVFFGLMFVAGTVGTILFFAGKRGSGVRRVGGSIGLVCGLMFGVLVVMATMQTRVRMSSEQHFRHQKLSEMRQIGEELHRIPVQAEPPLPQPLPPPQKVDTGLTRLPAPEPPADAVTAIPEPALVPNHDRTAVTETTAQRPQWATVGESKQGDVTHIVLTSKQYSTVEEARNEVAAEATRLLVQDFEKIYGTSAKNLRDLPTETLSAIAVRKEHIETVDRDFGNFTAPMHRVWWQLELSPVVRTSLHPLWKSRVQEMRVLFVGGGLLAATVCLAGISLFSHRRKPIPVPEPPPAKAAVVVVGIGALTLLAQRCKRWWQT